MEIFTLIMSNKLNNFLFKNELIGMLILIKEIIGEAGN